MNKTVLMIGLHFPPSALSTGHLRLLAFAKHLPARGWDPVVLCASRCAYEHTDPASIGSIPDACKVHRAWALDSRRHLGLFGKYPSFLAQPDRWASWWPSAVALGVRLIKRYRVQAIWSTYPVMTAHCVAHTLNRLTAIPWIADFRDPVAVATAHNDARTIRSQARWEERVVERAACSVFTAPGAMRLYAERYPPVQAEGRFEVIGNGYNESAFSALPARTSRPTGRPLVLVHSGALYREGRDPVPFFTALARLHADGTIRSGDLKVVLRASGSEQAYARELQRLGLDGIVVLAPRIPAQDALAEQADADGLLLFQGTEYDRQIPAKLYEYLRIGRPIFALVGERGDTAALLRHSGGAELVALKDVEAITTRLSGFITALRAGSAPHARPEAVARYSREAGAASLAKLLDRVTGPRMEPAQA